MLHPWGTMADYPENHGTLPGSRRNLRQQTSSILVTSFE